MIDGSWKLEDYGRHWFCPRIFYLSNKQTIWYSHLEQERQESYVFGANLPIGGQFWIGTKTKCEKIQRLDWRESKE